MEAKINLAGGAALLILGIVAFVFPRWLTIPLGIAAVWLSVSLFINSFQLFKQAKVRDDARLKEPDNAAGELPQ